MKKTAIILVAAILSGMLMLNASAVLLGDANTDGKINAADARSILRFSAMLDEYDDEMLKICDVDKNGSLTAADARTVLRVAAELEEPLGELEEPTSETETAGTENPAVIEIKDGIGMSFVDFAAKYGNLTKDGTSDGTSMYHNDSVTVISDPAFIGNKLISRIIVTGAAYSLNGIFVGMNSDDAKTVLKSSGWTASQSTESCVSFTKQSDSMKITFQNGIVTEAELALAVSVSPIQPTQPDETQSSTQEKPEEPTSSQQNDKNEENNGNKLDINSLPADIQALVSGRFGFSGTMIGENSQPGDIVIYTDGVNISVDTKIDDISVTVLILSEKGKLNMYMVNPETKQYASFDPAFLGQSVDDFKVNIDIGNVSSTEITKGKITEYGIEYEVYFFKTASGTTKIYMNNDQIKRIQSVDKNGKALSRIDIKEFYQQFSNDVFSYAKYEKQISFLSLFLT